MSTLEWDPDPDGLDAPSEDPAPPARVSPQLFAALPEFVERYLAPLYARNLETPSAAWCPQWWRHVEGVTRLDALWQAWEELRQDPALGISTWLRDHADHHMAILLSAEHGPFMYCSPEKGHHARLQALPTQPAPPRAHQRDADQPHGVCTEDAAA